jgi:hypothetical protein
MIQLTLASFFTYFSQDEHFDAYKFGGRRHAKARNAEFGTARNWLTNY